MDSSKKKSTFSWVLEFAGMYKGSYILSIIFASISVLAGFVPYFYVAKIVRGLVEGEKDMNFYLLQCGIISLCWLINKIFHSISTTLSHKATFGVLAQIRRKLTKKLSLMPLGDVLEDSSGSYKNIIVERVDSIETTLAHIIPEMISNAVVPIGILVIMFTINWKLTLLSLISVPLGMIFYSLMMVGLEESFNNTIVKTKALNDTAIEYINGIEVIKAFGKTRSSYEKFTMAAKEGADCFIEWMRRCNLWQNMALTLLPAQLLTLLPFVGVFYMSGKVDGTDAMLLIILTLGLVSPFMVVAGHMDNLKKTGSIIAEVTSILEKRELIRPKTLKKKPVGNSIEFKDVHFGYSKKEVLHGINLTIKEGSVNALVGPSGSGKSTIAKLIASFWDPDKGRITYGGVDIKDIPLADYNKNIAYVSQDNYLFDETVMENIRMGNPDALDEDVINAAKACGCHDFIMKLEKGYDTIAGGAGGHLSGGERQRISIARAMLKNAPIVILDEATAYTDPENEALVQRSVAKLITGKTLIVIAHRLSTISLADCIFVVNKGNIEAFGSQDELLKKSPLYKQMWEAHITSKDLEVA
ncbi:ATP-binding cassette, subfamily B [Acetitomaculum ruminis DSM 5522]|uniref:ATP-binding cassette, subfamily B n=1 Tax=Acetitomaculum ruminis DSM 5522 TaxID=1120918 RepID=A0A1I1A6I9_9FIRM|nr:ABC transporter ATP-binding protein [Acetitomaculum ruminis]SFB32070.1 ATP-binding cassette, subfamily B [Acetitomaculum ruminis DSM 5522]